MSLGTRLLPSTGSASFSACVTATPDLAPLTIVDNSFHNGFPTVVRIPDGRLLVAYRKGTDHASNLDGQHIGRFSSDDGLTWGSEVTLWDPPSWTPPGSASDLNARTMQSGSVLMMTTVEYGDTLDDDFFAYCRRSTDNGATWTDVLLGTTFGTGGNHREVAGTPAVDLGDGTLITAIAGRTAGQSTANESVIVVFSSDDGTTWTTEVSVVSVSGQFYTEPWIIRLASGRLHMLIRRNDTGNIYRTYSDDGGLTWAAHAIAFSGHAKPAHIETPCGLLLYVGRPNPTGDAEYRVSDDKGATWSAAVTIDSANDNMTYADFVALDYRNILCVYGVENTAGTNSDIKSQVFALT